MTVRRCSNWSVVAKISRWCRPWRWRADEGALELAQQLLGGLGPVLVHRVRPAPRDPDQEVGIVPGRGARQGVLHPGRGVRVAGVPDPVQGERDDRRGPGGDFPGGDGGAEFPAHGRQRLAGESLAGAGCSRRGRAGAGPRDAPISSRARRNSTVFRYPSSAAAAGATGTPQGPRSRRHPHRRLHRPSGPGPASRGARRRRGARESSRQPVVHDVPAFAASAAACFRVRSTAPAATSWRYSTCREKSSTPPANIRRRPETKQRRVLHRRRAHALEQRHGAVHAGRSGGGRCPAPDLPGSGSWNGMKSLTASMSPYSQWVPTLLTTTVGALRRQIQGFVSTRGHPNWVWTPGEKSTDSGGPTTAIPAAATS